MTQQVVSSVFPSIVAPDTAPTLQSEGDSSSDTFSGLLSQELDDSPESAESSENATPEAPSTPPEGEPWTWFGVAQPVPTVPTAIPLLLVQLPATEGAPVAPLLPHEPPADPTAPLIGNDLPPNNPSPEPTHASRPIPEQKLPPPPAPSPAAPEQTAAKSPDLPFIPRGTLAAQRPPMLLQSDKRSHPAPAEASPEALSPETGALLSGDLQPVPLTLSASANATAHYSKQGGAESRTIDFILNEPSQPSVTSDQVETASETTEVSPVRTDLVIEKINQQVQILRGSTLERLEVVLRPDVNTELLVQVSRVNGEIQVQVRCERGDVASLEANWREVQQSLHNQGVKVEALQHSSNAADFSHSNSHQHGQRHGNSSGEIEPFAALLPLNTGLQPQSPNTAPASSSTSAGWQSWA